MRKSMHKSPKDKSSRNLGWYPKPEAPRESGVGLTGEIGDDLFEQQQESIRSTVERRLVELFGQKRGENDNALGELQRSEELLPLESGMVMDVVDLPELNLWQKFVNWLKKVNVTPQYLLCRQRSAQIRRKIEQMKDSAFREVPKNQLAQVEDGYKTYLDTWKFLERYEGDENWHSRLLIIWEEFLIYLKANEDMSGLNKFADHDLIATVLKRYGKHTNMVIECLRWILGNSKAKIKLLVESPVIANLPKNLVPSVFSQFVVHPIEVVRKSLQLMAELPDGYINNHNRSFRLIVFCTTTRNPTVEGLMDFISTRENEEIKEMIRNQKGN